MTTVYVITGERGEWSERSTWVEFVCSTQALAEQKIKEIELQKQRDHCIDLHKNNLLSTIFTQLEIESPKPEITPAVYPVFDKTRGYDKEYVKEHTQRKHAAQALDRANYGLENDWHVKLTEQARVQMDAQYNEDLVDFTQDRPDYEKARYTYEEVEML